VDNTKVTTFMFRTQQARHLRKQMKETVCLILHNILKERSSPLKAQISKRLLVLYKKKLWNAICT